ncbi:tyrosine-protein phosphatase [Arthrobacter mobilis]|uniref:Tyrosine-protein phosphatase n=1 Tax=Arthrobacter mobilis TaxID=2724944 RepID=A0A7X6QML1_9MICC|nr:tyrosine-protein phosphatase [Arthrobacter mobilis]NKX56570.1 tyrosine-protein phosphatase [Arthrobacter mobilis]
MITTPETEGTAVPLAPLVNLRDLGGLRVEGGYVRHGALWRSDDICLTTHEQLQDLVSAGLRAVIDLRSPEELNRTGRGPSMAYQIEHYHLPLTDGISTPAVMAEVFRAIRTPRDVGKWYAQLFRDRVSTILHALQVIAYTDGGVLFHCAAGKDRTGILAAVVLSCLGTDQRTIIADYALTRHNIATVLHRLDGGGTPPRSATGTFTGYAGHPLMGADEDNMRGMLETLSGEGGMMPVLRAAGYDDDLHSALKNRLVTPNRRAPTE